MKAMQNDNTTSALPIPVAWVRQHKRSNEVPPETSKANGNHLLVDDRNKYRSMWIRAHSTDWMIGGICINHLHGSSLHLGNGGCHPNLYGKRAVLSTQGNSWRQSSPRFQAIKLAFFLQQCYLYMVAFSVNSWSIQFPVVHGGSEHQALLFSFFARLMIKVIILTGVAPVFIT